MLGCVFAGRSLENHRMWLIGHSLERHRTWLTGHHPDRLLTEITRRATKQSTLNILGSLGLSLVLSNTHAEQSEAAVS